MPLAHQSSDAYASDALSYYCYAIGDYSHYYCFVVDRCWDGATVDDDAGACDLHRAYLC